MGKPRFEEVPEIKKIVNKRLSFPLSTLQAGNYTFPRGALIGDAAHTIHPMAGLGVNSGIMDSLILANNIIKNIRAGHDIGDMMALAQFESEAKVQNYANTLALDLGYLHRGLMDLSYLQLAAIAPV